jgi:hypothetical protein
MFNRSPLAGRASEPFFGAHQNSRPAFILGFTISGDLGKNLAQTQRQIRSLASRSLRNRSLTYSISEKSGLLP